MKKTAIQRSPFLSGDQPPLSGKAEHSREAATRRRFLKTSAATIAGGMLLGERARGCFAQTASRPAACRIDPEKALVGVHVAAHSFYDEGIEHCLDFLQETAGVNTLMVTSNSYYGAMLRPKEVQGDHGVPIRDGRGRKISRIWFKPHEKYYRETSLRHLEPKPNVEYSGREIFRDIADAARQRGIRIHERMYEPNAEAFKHLIRGGEKVLTVDVHGRPGEKPCWNHPEYVGFVVGSVRDLFESYPLDGIQFGAERNGPLSRLIDWPEAVPTCFCEHCKKRAEEEGVDFDEARRALSEMNDSIVSLRNGGAAGPDGPLIEFLRLLMENPVILEWENLHYRVGEELHQKVYDTIKSIDPEAEVGRHIDHAQSSWDFFFRAAMPYSRMAKCNDYLKLTIYHEVFGPRLRRAVDRYTGHIAGQLSESEFLDLFYAIVEHDPQREPTVEQLQDGILSAEYVYRETQRAVEQVDGRAAIYAGIALDVPVGSGWGTIPRPSDPEELEKAVHRAFDAGARGLVICREYEEMRQESLRVVGHALRERFSA